MYHVHTVRTFNIYGVIVIVCHRLKIKKLKTLFKKCIQFIIINYDGIM